MRYFITPNYCVALNAKVASSSLARRIIATYYPETEGKLQRAHYPPGFNANRVQLHGFVAGTYQPDRPVAMLVREPLDRFLSGVAYLNMNLESAIESLLTGVRTTASHRGSGPRPINVSTNIHFARQSEMPYGETHLFRFPDHVFELAALLGIGSVPRLNVTPKPQPAVTDEQRDAILGHYAADVALYESITAPDTVLLAPTPARTRRRRRRFVGPEAQ
jgi:hypothetical protein